jgi:hypothetical protein
MRDDEVLESITFAEIPATASTSAYIDVDGDPFEHETLVIDRNGDGTMDVEIEAVVDGVATLPATTSAPLENTEPRSRGRSTSGEVLGTETSAERQLLELYLHLLQVLLQYLEALRANRTEA